MPSLYIHTHIYIYTYIHNIYIYKYFTRYLIEGATPSEYIYEAFGALSLRLWGFWSAGSGIAGAPGFTVSGQLESQVLSVAKVILKILVNVYIQHSV